MMSLEKSVTLSSVSYDVWNRRKNIYLKFMTSMSDCVVESNFCIERREVDLSRR